MIRRIARLAAMVVSHRQPLRTRPLASIDTDLPSPGQAVRWLGDIEVAGDRRTALFAHPRSTVTFAVRALPGDVVTAGCALLPDAWPRNTGGVEFTLTVTATATGAGASDARVVNPGTNPEDRRWRELRVRAPVDREQPITIALTTSVPPGAATDHAWAIWGDPAVTRRRPRGEVIEALTRAVATAARRGPRAAVRELRADARLDERTAAYRRWARAHAPGAAALATMTSGQATLPYRPLISIITPVYNTDPAFLRACIASVRAQAYPNWELCLCDDGSTLEATRAVLREQTDPRIHLTFLESNARISAASNAALTRARGEFVALLDHDDELTPDALYRVVRHLNDAPGADVVYSDEDKRDADGGLSEPFFKPCWSPEHLLSAMYTCHLTVARKSLVDRIGGFRVGYEGAQDHDLMLRLSDVTERIDHLPHVLYHWRRAPESTATAGSAKPWADDAGKRALEDYLARHAIEGEVVSGGVPGLYRVKFAIHGRPLVTVVITGAGAGAVRDLTTYADFEIVTVAEGDGATARVNEAARRARGDHLVFVDASLRPMDGEWLTAMLEYSQQPAIGAAGAKIQYADGRLRHIGLVTCLDGGPAAIFEGHPGDSYGYFSSAIGVRNYAAVSGECLMTRRDVFERMGGYDERLPWPGADVDYCARVRASGLRVVFTPYARLQCASAGAAVRAADEAAEDPYYNPNLSRATRDYTLDA